MEMEREIPKTNVLTKIEDFLSLQREQGLRPMVVEGRLFQNAKLTPLFYVACFAEDDQLINLKFNTVSLSTHTKHADWFRHILAMSPYQIVDFDKPASKRKMKAELPFYLENNVPVYLLTFGMCSFSDKERAVTLLNTIKSASPKEALIAFEKCASAKLFGEVLKGI